MTRHQLIFTSRPTVTVTDAVLLDILFKAQHNNARNGISGILLFLNERFVQLIETPDQATAEKHLDRIRQDKRHTDITVIYSQPAPEMCMPAWAMGFSMAGNEDSTIREHAFYIHMDEVRQICAAMPGALGSCFRDFLQAD